MTNFTKRIVIASFGALVAVGFAARKAAEIFLQDNSRAAANNQRPTADKKPEAAATEEKFSVTHHTATIGGQQIAYTATLQPTC